MNIPIVNVNGYDGDGSALAKESRLNYILQLAVGKEVIAHTDAVSVPGWSGAGYIIYDPVTGDGAYKIGGGANGVFIQLLGYLLMAIYLTIAAAVFVAGLLIIPFIAVAILVTTIATILSIQDIKRIWANCSSFGAAMLTFLVIVQNIAGIIGNLLTDIVSLFVQVTDAISLTTIFPDPIEDPICDL